MCAHMQLSARCQQCMLTFSAGMEKEAHTIVIISWKHIRPYFVCRQCLSLSLELTSWLDTVANKPQASHCLCWNWGKAEGSGDTRVNRGHMWRSCLCYDVKDVTRSVLGLPVCCRLGGHQHKPPSSPGKWEDRKSWSVRQRELAFWVSWFPLSSVNCLEVPRNGASPKLFIDTNDHIWEWLSGVF